MIATDEGLGLYGGFVDRGLTVRLVEIGVKDDGRWLPLDGALGASPMYGQAARMFLVQAPLTTRGRQRAQEHIRYELLGRKRDVYACFDGLVIAPEQAWSVPAIVSAPPNRHLREFGLGQGHLFSGLLPTTTHSIAFDNPAIDRALRVRRRIISDAENALCGMNGGELSVALMMQRLVHPLLDDVVILEVHD